MPLLMRRHPAYFALVLFLATATCFAQEKAAPATAVVTGRVTFADTNGPARFSKVLLKSMTPDAADNPFAELMKDAADSEGKSGKNKLSPEEEAEQKRTMAASMKVLSQMSDLLQATTVAGDGTYTFTDIKPGTYYLHATAKGYIDPLEQFTPDELASTDPATRKRIAAVATIVTVSGNNGVHADLRLERGASISGRVLYDDGTPAVGFTVRTVHDAPDDPNSPFAAMGLDASDMDLSHLQEASITDDTGYYRIAGLATGSYVVQARLATTPPGRSSPSTSAGIGASAGGNAFVAMLGLKLTVYSGNALRRSEAKPITVRQGQNLADTDLTLPLHSMHALGGTVRAKSDGHPVMGGSIALTAQTADGKDDLSFHQVAAIRHDGTFQFDYIPGPASYTLKVTGAIDTAPGTTAPKKIFGQTISDEKTTHKYGPATASAALGDSDLTDLKIDVPDSPAP